MICWAFDFEEWLTENGEDFPVPQAEFESKIAEFILTDRGQELLAGAYIGQINGKTQWMRFRVSSPVVQFSVSKIKKPWYDKFEARVDKFNDEAPEGIQGMRQTAGFEWGQMNAEDAFVSNMQQGIMIGIFFSGAVLFAVTLNIIQTFFSIISISAVITTVLAMIYMSGWPLGVAESCASVIVVGFAVDYVVHLSAHYIHSTEKKRKDKMDESLRALGISILGGGVTTLGAGVFLLPAVISIFWKIAGCLITTIVASLFFSLCYFSALCYMWGPENDFGSIKPWLDRTKKRLKEKCRRKNSASRVDSIV